TSAKSTWKNSTFPVYNNYKDIVYPYYQITYEKGNDDTVSGEDPVIQYFFSGQGVTLRNNTYSKPNSIFDRWNAEQQDEYNGKYYFDGDITLYPMWTDDKAVFVFDAMG